MIPRAASVVIGSNPFKKRRFEDGPGQAPVALVPFVPAAAPLAPQGAAAPQASMRRSLVGMLQLQQRFTPHSRVTTAHARDQRIRTDFSLVKHDYYIDAVKRDKTQHWYSYSGLKEKLFKKFDRDYVAKRAAAGPAAKSDPKYTGMDVEAIAEAKKGEWDATRDSGSLKHEAFDAILQHDALTLASLVAVPPAFWDFLAFIADDWDVECSEKGIFDEASQVYGEFDLLLRHRHTGVLKVADFKNCNSHDFTKGSNECGRHPFTVDVPDTRYGHYGIQVNFYREILARHYYARDQLDPVSWLINFHPQEPEGYRIYDVPLMDMQPLWALLPWHDDDPRHSDFFLGRPDGLVPRFPDTDPRALEGPTTRVCVLDQDKPLDDTRVVWTGALYPSATARKKTADAVAAARARNEPFQHLLAKYELPESPLKHPWYWYGKPPPTAYGYYEYRLLHDRALLAHLPALVDKALACWCSAPGDRCQADVLCKYANLYAAGAFALPQDPLFQ